MTTFDRCGHQIRDAPRQSLPASDASWPGGRGLQGRSRPDGSPTPTKDPPVIEDSTLKYLLCGHADVREAFQLGVVGIADDPQGKSLNDVRELIAFELSVRFCFRHQPILMQEVDGWYLCRSAAQDTWPERPYVRPMTLSRHSCRQSSPVLSVRSAVILLLAVLAGIGGAALTVMAGEVPPKAVLTGFAAAGGAAVLFNMLIGPG